MRAGPVPASPQKVLERGPIQPSCGLGFPGRLSGWAREAIRSREWGAEGSARWALPARAGLEALSASPSRLLAGPSGNDVGGEGRPARPRQGGRRPVHLARLRRKAARPSATPGTPAGAGPQACAALPGPCMSAAECVATRLLGTDTSPPPSRLVQPPPHTPPCAQRLGGWGRRRRACPGHRVTAWGTCGDVAGPQLVTSVCPPTSLSSHPDALPVFGPGHKPDHPAPWASGQSVPGTRPARLPPPPTPIGGQTRTSDILQAGGHGVGGGLGSCFGHPTPILTQGGALVELEIGGAEPSYTQREPGTVHGDSLEEVAP